MLKIENLRIDNFCGYQGQHEFNFHPQINILYGPNGYGKSNFLRAIQMLTSKMTFSNRADIKYRSDEQSKMVDPNILKIRRFVFDSDYDPTYCNLTKAKNNLSMEASFSGSDKSIDTKITYENEELSFDLDSLPTYEPCSRYLDADNRFNMRSFQLETEVGDKFIEIAKVVYGLDCILDDDTNTDLMDEGTNYSFFSDLVIVKNGNKVHYKAMSDGEKKLATFLSSLLDLQRTDIDLILVDNVELHLYWKRHVPLIEKLIEMFPTKQFIMTTHSPEIIRHVGEKYGDKSLIDLEKIKDNIVI